MYRNGIVAVGDICNTSNTFGFKKDSKIYYHNFIEVYAFDEAKAEAAFARGVKLQSEAGKNSSVTPHAPYSASKKLLKLIAAHAQQQSTALTIHMQETADEDLFFKQKKGNILERLKDFGIPTDSWIAPGISSLQYTLPQLPQQNKVQLVHNTFTPARDIIFAQEQHQNLYWCLCPNANLYIEGTTAQIDFFRRNNCIITLGTDSYASNWQLSILSEIRSLKTKFPQIPLEELLLWSTLNGAKFLGIEERFGSIEKNKKPGLNLISPDLQYVTKLI
jgi:cytosine/adenosine deaminase-related metal-dependent hydrolase